MRITVIGAYGYTGRLICNELENHGLKFSIAGRDEAKLKRFKTTLKTNPDSFPGDILEDQIAKKIIADSDILINCAGPFTEESQNFLALVSASGKIYLDITGEIGFLKNSRESFHETALKSNTLIIHGCAFESLLVDLVLQIVSREADIKEIQTLYWFNNKRVSPGSRLTMKLSKFRIPLTIQDGTWSHNETSAQTITRESDQQKYSAVSYPLPEVAFAFWKYKVEFAATYLLLNPAEAQFINRDTVLDGNSNEELRRLRQKKQDGPTENERADQRSEIRIAIKLKNNSAKFFLIENRDMYQTTAVAIRLAVQKIMSGVSIYGVRNPASLFENEEEKTIKALNSKLTEEKNWN